MCVCLCLCVCVDARLYVDVDYMKGDKDVCEYRKQHVPFMKVCVSVCRMCASLSLAPSVRTLNASVCF